MGRDSSISLLSATDLPLEACEDPVLLTAHDALPRLQFLIREGAMIFRSDEIGWHGDHVSGTSFAVLPEVLHTMYRPAQYLDAGFGARVHENGALFLTDRET